LSWLNKKKKKKKRFSFSCMFSEVKGDYNGGWSLTEARSV
jgi:hypothetical protein